LKVLSRILQWRGYGESKLGKMPPTRKYKIGLAKMQKDCKNCKEIAKIAECWRVNYYYKLSQPQAALPALCIPLLLSSTKVAIAYDLNRSRFCSILYVTSKFDQFTDAYKD